jgi:hypothetical protein
MPSEDFADPRTEVTFDFQNEAADAPIFVGGPVREDLLGEGIHTRCRFPRPDCADNGDARKEPTFRDDQPARCFRRHLRARMVQLADDQRKFGPFCRVRVKG